MRVSIFLCFRVSVLKSLNYACKNLTYAYICMKVYSLAGQRETSVTVSKRQTEVVRFGLLQGGVLGHSGNLLGYMDRSETCEGGFSCFLLPSAFPSLCGSAPLSLSRLIAQNLVPVFPWFSNQFCLLGHFFPFLLPSQLEECC